MNKSEVGRRERAPSSSANPLFLILMQCLSPVDVKPAGGNASLRTASNSFEMLNEAKDSIIRDIEDGEALIADINKHITDLLSQRADHEAAMIATMSSAESFNKIIAENKGASIRLSKSAPHLNKRFNAVMNQATSCKDSISAYMIELSTEIAHLDSQINAHASKRATIESSIESDKISLQSYNKVILENKDSIARLNRSIGDIAMGQAATSGKVPLSARTMPSVYAKSPLSRRGEEDGDESVSSLGSKYSRKSRRGGHRSSRERERGDKGERGHREHRRHRSRDVPPPPR